MAFPSACMAVVRKDHKIKMRPPHTGCDGRDGGPCGHCLLLFLRFGQGLFGAVGLVDSPTRIRRPAVIGTADHNIKGLPGCFVHHGFLLIHGFG